MGNSRDQSENKEDTEIHRKSNPRNQKKQVQSCFNILEPLTKCFRMDVNHYFWNKTNNPAQNQFNQDVKSKIDVKFISR